MTGRDPFVLGALVGVACFVLVLATLLFSGDLSASTFLYVDF